MPQVVVLYCTEQHTMENKGQIFKRISFDFNTIGLNNL